MMKASVVTVAPEVLRIPVTCNTAMYYIVVALRHNAHICPCIICTYVVGK